MSATARVTADEYLAQPYDDMLPRTELISGEVVVNDPATLHQLVVGELHLALATWSRSPEGSGGVVLLNHNVRISDDTVLGPDLSWYSPERAPGHVVWVPGPADLVIEVRSPSTWRRDHGVKKDAYEARGVRELWLVDPSNRAVLVFRASGADGFDSELTLGHEQALASPLLPGFSLPVAGLFDV